MRNFKIDYENFMHSIAYTFQLGLYVVSFASNIIIIFLAPSEEVQSYINLYVISSAFFSLFVYIQFTGNPDPLKIKISFLVFSIIYIYMLLKGDLGVAAYIFLPYFYLISDHIASQKSGVLAAKLFRSLSLLTLIPFFIKDMDFLYAVELRIAYFMIAFIYLVSSKGKISGLQIKAPWRFVVFCYICYTLPLYLITILAKDSISLKIWYSITQIGIAMILKVYEFNSRLGSEYNKSLFKFLVVLAMAIPLVTMTFSFEIVLLQVYLFGLLIVVLIRRYA